MLSSNCLEIVKIITDILVFNKLHVCFYLQVPSKDIIIFGGPRTEKV